MGAIIINHHHAMVTFAIKIYIAVTRGRPGTTDVVSHHGNDCTVEPAFNEPPYNEFLDIMKFFYSPLLLHRSTCI